MELHGSSMSVTEVNENEESSQTNSAIGETNPTAQEQKLPSDEI